MTDGSGVRWLWLILGVIAADRASKYAVERFTAEGYQRELIPSFAFLVHSVNPGIAFGFLSESTPRWVSLSLIVLAAAVLCFLGWLLSSGRAGGGALTCAGLALVAGGAAGNLIDRIVHGGVTDFLELRAGSFRWPAFNVADSAITIGAFLVAFAMLRSDRRAAGERA